LILTTEKDAVRFPRPAELDVPVFFLRIEVEILEGHDLWEKLIDRLCLPHDPGETLLLTRAAHAV
jgi:tetraacyldisaccharide 4'-kinase